MPRLMEEFVTTFKGVHDEGYDAFAKDLIQIERTTIDQTESDEERVQNLDNWIWRCNDLENTLFWTKERPTCAGCDRMEESQNYDNDPVLDKQEEEYGSCFPTWRLKGTTMYFCRFCYEKVKNGERVAIKLDTS